MPDINPGREIQVMDEQGFAAVNNQLSLVISNVFKPMVFSERGSFKITSKYTDANGYGQVTFLKPVTTQEPPQVFLRVSQASHYTLGLYATLEGAAGRWTGFRVVSAARFGKELQNYTVEYVTTKFADSYNPDVHGFESRGEQGEPIFSSADKVVQYSRFTKSWTVYSGELVNIYSSGLSLDADDFVSITSFDRGVSWFINGASYAGLTIYDNGKPALDIFITKATGGQWYYQGTDGSNFSIPICKFPEWRYANS